MAARTHWILATASAVFALAAIAVAGTVQAVPVEWGVHGGLSLSRVTHNLADEESFRGLAGAGITATIAPRGAAPWSFETGLSFVRKGGISGFPLYTGDASGNVYVLLMQDDVWTLDYVEMPVLARLSRDLAGLRCFVKAGVEAGLLLGARARYPDWSRHGEIVEEDVGHILDDFDMSAVAGVGAHVPLRGRMALRLESLYVHGLTNVYGAPHDWIVMRTRAIRFNVGIDLIP